MTTETPIKFSVLMSLYAAEQPEYLRQSLQSLAKQTRPADEIILVYDGAVGAELEAAATAFQATLPLKIFRLPENAGLGRALAAGATQCTHEWIFRMDTDDIAAPDRFAKQCAYLAAHPDTDVLGGQIAEFDRQPENQIPSRRSVPLSHNEIARRARTRNPINHMTAAIRTAALAAAGGYRHAPLYEDYDLWVRMLLNGSRFANLPDTLVYARAGAAMYRRRGGWQYARTEAAMQYLFYRRGFLTLPQLARNLALRLPLRLLPSSFRALIYQTLLRNRQPENPFRHN